MATELNNLSDRSIGGDVDCSTFKVSIVVSEWNDSITGALHSGAVDFLKNAGVRPENIESHYVPGSFELPTAAQFVLEASDAPDAVVCLGSVIRGETEHFTFVCNTVSQGVKDVSLKYNKPVIFGVLTDDTQEQAEARSGGKHGNKGVEAAAAAIKMIALKNRITGA